MLTLALVHQFTQQKVSLHMKQVMSLNVKVILSQTLVRNSRPEVFLGKGVLKICNTFTGEHPCRCAISTTLQSNFVEITLLHGCSPVNLLHIFRTHVPKNTSGRLLLY